MSDTAVELSGEHVIAFLDDYSIEMTGKDVPGLDEARDALPHGTRVNVTYLGAEDLEQRVTAARAVREHGLLPVPHIAARRLTSEQELARFLDRLAEVQAIDKVFVIGGDPSEAAGPYPDALTLIRSGVLERHGVREVGIAGYPEGHPDIPNSALWEHLEAKVETLRERGLQTVIVTQFGFDTEPVVAWIRELRSRGIDAPVRVGVPGPAGVKRLLGFARRFGIGANAMIVKKYGFSLTNLLGTAGPDRFVASLATQLTEQGLAKDVKMHLYAFGGLRATAEWAQRFTLEGARR
ncbi:methylenetetrahydrofolate reductase [Leifsonia shinshuensis]|uniref:Methylenetetrahydrofolate reductase n=1 Tax=Leifsonia shinshuensis TaxID=150026 RepID=A0A853CYF7_9MICO|nr:methylenetetrahydrofolate reductase [Leifsonia shinshuensis]NYJ25627.1 methylenetetrahydrofolate reductase (NADPH) [Leifsonia shinshuensis]